MFPIDDVIMFLKISYVILNGIIWSVNDYTKSLTATSTKITLLLLSVLYPQIQVLRYYPQAKEIPNSGLIFIRIW